MKFLFPPTSNYFIFGFPHEEPSIFILFPPNFFAEIKRTNYIKIRDAKILGKTNVNLFLAMNLFRYPSLVL